MNDKHYIRNYFKVVGKIVGNTLTIAILASIISFFAFKNYFDFVLWVSAAVLFIMLPLLVASFFAVLIVDVNSSEKKKNWQKAIVGGILALVGLALARLAAIPCVGLGWNDSLTAKILNQVIIGFMAVSVIATLIELVGCGKNALRDKIEGTNLSYYKLKLNSGVFYLTELQVLIASIFVASLFFPATYFIKFPVTALYCALALIAAVLSVLIVFALFKGISFFIQYRYCKAFDIVREEIRGFLEQRLFLSEEDIKTLCEITNPKIIAKYHNLIKHILNEEIKNGELKQVTLNNTLVYTTRDPEKLRKEYFKKISILNKKDLAVLGIGTSLTLIKSVVAYPLIADMLGIGKGIDRTNLNNRLDHDAKKITDAERKKLKHFADKHPELSEKAASIIFTMSVPYDTIGGSKAIGKSLSGNTHRLETLGHDRVLGWFFGVINILTDTITFRDFSTYRVMNGMIIPGDISFIDCLFEAANIVSKTPDCFAAALCKQAVHICSDMFTKLGLPIPVIEVLFPKVAKWLYVGKNYDYLCGLRDLGAITASAIIEILINLTIRMIHGMLFDPDTDNKELYDIRTKIITMIADNIAASGNAVLAIAKHNPKYLDVGGIIVSIGQTVITTKSVVGTYWNLKYDPTDNLEIKTEIAKYQIKELELNS